MTNWIQSLKSPTCCRDSFCLEDPLHSSQDTHQPNAEKHKNVAWEMKIRTQVMSGTKIVANPQNGVTSCHKHIGVEQNFLGRLWTSTVVHSSVTWSKHGKCCTVIHPSWESLYIYIYILYIPHSWTDAHPWASREADADADLLGWSCAIVLTACMFTAFPWRHLFPK
jgi:hypothetical protein